MTDKNIGKLKKVNLREIWKKEDKDFTPWLMDNIDSLNESLGISLSSVEKEISIGPFSADLVAETPDNHIVIIENQFTKTDHDHLGKMLTYLTNIGTTDPGAGAIWISKDPRPEHVKAIEWLNEITPLDFYLVKLEAIQIDESAPAPLFTIVAGPTKESKMIGSKKKELAERHVKRRTFWANLLEESKKRTKLLENLSATTSSFLTVGVGKTGIHINPQIYGEYGGVYFYVEFGEKEDNKRIFDWFLTKKEEIEKDYGKPLCWERKDNQKSSRFGVEFRYAGYLNEEKWPKLQDEMIDAIIALHAAVKKHVKKAPL